VGGFSEVERSDIGSLWCRHRLLFRLPDPFLLTPLSKGASPFFLLIDCRRAGPFPLIPPFFSFLRGTFVFFHFPYSARPSFQDFDRGFIFPVISSDIWLPPSPGPGRARFAQVMQIHRAKLIFSGCQVLRLLSDRCVL